MVLLSSGDAEDQPLVTPLTAERLAHRFGAVVSEPWIARVEDSAAGYAERWGLDGLAPVGHGTTAVVLRAVRRATGDAVYLKLTPEPGLAVAEARALDHWATSGRVPLVLERDTRGGALLLEGIDGAPLSASTGALDLREVAGLITALHDLPPAGAHPFPPLGERVGFLFALWSAWWSAGDPALAARLDAGAALAAGLASDAPRGMPVLLHGDLHPGNVFLAGHGRGLVALDPRPCIGDQAFDLVDWVLFGTDDPAEWADRSEELAALVGCHAGRTWDWCRAFATPLAELVRRRGGSDARIAALSAIAP